MQKNIIRRANRLIRRTRPLLDASNICNTFYNNGTLEIGFLSKQCKNDANGSCLMCDYGATNCSFSTKDYEDKMKEILQKEYSNRNNLLLCTNGSIFDQYQISRKTLETIIKIAARSMFKKVTFETHYQDINSDILNLIKQYITDKEVVIEMGLETINQKYQDEIILKNINIDRYEQTIKFIQSYGFTVEVNIMVGLPFLSQHEQYTYAYEAINWALERNCLATVFPINIKPFTLLNFAKSQGLYAPISHWLLIFILNNIKYEYLNKLTVAWYGNRKEEYEGYENSTVFPASCNKCHDFINEFYAAFNHAPSSEVRKKLLMNLYADCQCECKNKIDTANATIGFNTLYPKFIKLVKNEILQ